MLLEFLAMIAGMLGGFAIAFLLACWDPVWGRRTSFCDAVSSIVHKD
jgi:hypothetical protein